MFDADFYTLIDNIDKNTTYQDIINLVGVILASLVHH